MIDKETTLQDILPSSIRSDKTVQDITAALQTSLGFTKEEIGNVLILSQIDTIPEELIDTLAWQFHVDTYDLGLSVAQKRQLVKNAIKDHKYKGTSWAVKSVVEVLLNYAKVEQWWEYQGKPYHFRVNSSQGPLTDEEQVENLVNAINQAKNVRSWLDGISFYRDVSVPKSAGIGVYVYKRVDIGLPEIENPVVHVSKSVGTGTYIFKKVVIGMGGV